MTRYHALIRTHHITSRRKVATLRAAARQHQCTVLLRAGGVPGLMYVAAGSAEGVAAWVDVVRGLRYKDYKVLAAPSDVSDAGKERHQGQEKHDEGELDEVAEVKDFGRRMEELGLWEWWRGRMGFVKGG